MGGQQGLGMTLIVGECGKFLVLPARLTDDDHDAFAVARTRPGRSATGRHRNAVVPAGFGFAGCRERQAARHDFKGVGGGTGHQFSGLYPAAKAIHISIVTIHWC